MVLLSYLLYVKRFKGVNFMSIHIHIHTYMPWHALIGICGCPSRIHSAHSSYVPKGVETDSHEVHLAYCRNCLWTGRRNQNLPGSQVGDLATEPD